MLILFELFPRRSDVTLDDEFFRCNDPGLDEFIGFRLEDAPIPAAPFSRDDFFVEYPDRATDALTDGVVPADVPDRMEIASSAKFIRRCDRPSESPQADSGPVLPKSADFNEGRM